MHVLDILWHLTKWQVILRQFYRPVNCCFCLEEIFEEVWKVNQSLMIRRLLFRAKRRTLPWNHIRRLGRRLLGAKVWQSWLVFALWMLSSFDCKSILKSVIGRSGNVRLRCPSASRSWASNDPLIWRAWHALTIALRVRNGALVRLIPVSKPNINRILIHNQCAQHQRLRLHILSLLIRDLHLQHQVRRIEIWVRKRRYRDWGVEGCVLVVWSKSRDFGIGRYHHGLG